MLLNVRVLKQVKTLYAFCIRDKIIYCSSFLLFNAVNSTFPFLYMLSCY